MKRIVLSALAIMLMTVCSASAQSKYEKMFVKDSSCVAARGEFMNLFKKDGKLYAELPNQYLGRDMLLATTISAISNGEVGDLGYKPSDPMHVKFVQVDSTVFLANATIAPEVMNQDEIKKAVDNVSLPAIILSFKKTCDGPDGKSIVFEATSLFMNALDKLSAIPEGSSSGISTTASFKESSSAIDCIKAFEDNVSVKSYLTYQVSQSVLGLLKLMDKEPVTVYATRTLLLLPEQAAKSRTADSRVGIFLTNRALLDGSKDMSSTYSVINRWNLQLADTAAYIAGNPSNVTNPIVFYLDDAFPARYRQSAKTGIERWNKAFEKIGLLNVVQVRDYPQDDPDFDPDNLKYSCIRYMPSSTANAKGPSWVDPRSGEIINASVIVYSDVTKLINSWRFIQTSQVDERVRAVTLPEEVMQESIAYVLAHEVGHCLGFMHNMSASSTFPTDSLRSATFTQKYGTTPSIMDYARFNYVAQPGDKGVKLTPPDLGVYDEYLVEYAYKPYFGKTEAEEAKLLEAFVDSHAGDPLYRYGRQQVRYRYDPTAIEEDLGDDAVKASAYGVSNLKYIIENMPQWITDADDPAGSHREILYGQILTQYNRYLAAVMMNVGGIRLTAEKACNGAEKYVAVDAEKQRESLHWVMEQIDDCGWIYNPEIAKVLNMMVNRAEVVAFNNTIDLFDTYKNVVMSAHVAENSGCTDIFTPEEWMQECYDWVWKKALKGEKLTVAERNKQSLYVKEISTAAGKTPTYTSASLYKLDGREYLPTLDHMLAFGLIDSNMAEQYGAWLKEYEEENGAGAVAAAMAGSACGETDFGPAGYGWQASVNTKVIDFSYELNCKYAGKSLEVLKKAARRAHKEDKAHYNALIKTLGAVVEK